MNTHRTLETQRRGTVLLVVVISLVCLCGFIALAIDVGMIAAAKAECQQAADAAALTGARALDGRAETDLPAATAWAQTAAMANEVLSETIDPDAVEVQHGSFHYDPASERFSPQIPPSEPGRYNLTRVSVSHGFEASFARSFGIGQLDVVASATAAHRPRDVAILLDFSGSMNNESDLWNNEGYLGSANNSPNNLDPIFPRFGHYSDVGAARLQTTSTDPRVGKCNITQPALGVPALVHDFFQHSRGDPTQGAFSSSPDSFDEQPGGDLPLRLSKNTGSGYAQTLSAVNSLGGTDIDPAFELYGYDYYILYRVFRESGLSDEAADVSARDVLDTTPETESVQAHLFKGYTVGPKSWGKTFFAWPPNPVGRHAGLPDHPTTPGVKLADWRMRFFLKPGGSHPNYGGPVDDNTLLWNGSGVIRDPEGNYVINYREILAWIKSGPNPFPPQLRAGRILYYDAIPDDVPASAYQHSQRNYEIADPNQRFWKEYIDFVLGVWRDPNGAIQRPARPACSYGPDFNWGNRQIQARPNDGRSMNYGDNPQRPRHRFWFGPMTMVQYLLDVGILPGTAHDISMYSAKLGIGGAIEEIKNNHPNDLVSLIPFNRPRYHNEQAGAFNQAHVPLSRDYDAMQDALWFPPNSGGADVRPWDADGQKTPRAFGDFTSNTGTQHGFMLAYNQFTSSSDVRAQAAGGWGRKGTQRLVILESDGMANVNTRPDSEFHNAGANRSYYRILPGDTIQSGSYVEADMLDVVRKICAMETDSLLGPGYTTPRRRVKIHTIAFGAIFEPTAEGSDQSGAVDLFQKISQIGLTSFPASSADPYDGYKWCIGTLDERKDRLRAAFARVMDDGVSVTLIE